MLIHSNSGQFWVQDGISCSCPFVTFFMILSSNTPITPKMQYTSTVLLRFSPRNNRRKKWLLRSIKSPSPEFGLGWGSIVTELLNVVGVYFRCADF